MASLIPAAFRPLRLALVQLATTADKQANLQRARRFVNEASKNGANVVVLPVCYPSRRRLFEGMLQQSGASASQR
jgi:predicted amidohydrolase